LRGKVAFLAQISESELLIELRTNVYISFGSSSTDLAAHALLAFGGSSSVWQNSELHRTIASVLDKFLAVPPARFRITRVQLYEIIEHDSALPLSARREPRSPTSPRSPDKEKEKKEKKGWSKSLERKKASDLTAMKHKKFSSPGPSDYTDNMKHILQDESETSSDVSGSR
jgi:hypothetical protein